jgi:hypothetical protein
MVDLGEYPIGLSSKALIYAKKTDKILSIK